MNRKKIFAAVLALSVLILALVGCGSKEPAETQPQTQLPAQPQEELPALGLTEWSMNATTWSSPNGATVNITAVPVGHVEGRTATFVIRLEGDEIANVPCEWNGTAYTASAELNAADGYCYYILQSDADGNSMEIPVNIPTEPLDETLINLADALSSYCEVAVTASSAADNKLTVTEGSAQIRLPRITRDEGSVGCDQAVLVLSYNGEDVALEKLTVPAADETGLCTVDLAGTAISIPGDMEDDHQLTMRLDVTLSNGHVLTAAGGTWYYLDGDLLLAVG